LTQDLKKIGISATTKEKVLFEAEVELRNDIVDLLSTRRECRRARRNRKTRYRKPRFNNRISGKKDGWLAPSVRQKIGSHLAIIGRVYKILPITNIVVEVASFDIQKIKDPTISGEEYQKGEQLGFWNTREYVLHRDNHLCQCCRGKSKDKILNVHHIESRKTGGNAPNNLVTLCETCHRSYHRGKIVLPKSIKRTASYRDATFMGVMRWAFYNELKAKYNNVSLTYGYVTKNTRIKNALPKEHYIDARCISKNPKAETYNIVYYYKKVRCHNRQIHKSTILKGGYRKRNQAEYLVKGFALFDSVKYQGEEYFVFGRRNSGYFDIRKLDGTKANNGSISFKKLKLVQRNNCFLAERRSVSSHD